MNLYNVVCVVSDTGADKKKHCWNLTIQCWAVDNHEAKDLVEYQWKNVCPYTFERIISSDKQRAALVHNTHLSPRPYVYKDVNEYK